MTDSAVPAAAPVAPPLSAAQLDASHQADLAHGRSIVDINSERVAWNLTPLAPMLDPVAAWRAEQAKPEVRLAELKRDPAFSARLLGGDSLAKAQWEQVHVALANGQMLPPEGGDPTEPNPAPAAAAATPEAAAIDTDAAFPACKPDGSDIDLTGVFATDGDSPAALEGAKELRAIGGVSQMPAATISAIYKEAARWQSTWETMPEPAREAHAAKVHQQWTQLHGDTAPAKLALAQALVKEIEAKRPGMVDLLERSGAGSNLFVIGHLAMHAERLAARRGITIGSIMAKLKAKGS